MAEPIKKKTVDVAVAEEKMKKSPTSVFALGDLLKAKIGQKQKEIDKIEK